jgi:hypothetical protein
LPLGGLLPYEDEEEGEFPVSPEFGDLTDLQEMGPDGDRDLMEQGGDLMTRLMRRRTKMPQGVPQVAGQPGGMAQNLEGEPNVEAVRALLQGFRG